jgi:hypothetical protein
MKKHVENDIGNILDQLFDQDDKKRTKKSRRKNEKELLLDYNQEIERERDKSNQTQRKIYENIGHLSQNEKQNFENKFTKPKNPHQEEYVTILRDPEKKNRSCHWSSRYWQNTVCHRIRRS